MNDELKLKILQKIYGKEFTLEDLKNLDRKQNAALEKYANTDKDPILATSWSDTPQDAARFLNELGIQEDPSVLEYFKSYVNSPGFDRIVKNQSEWWKKRHPYGKLLDFGDHNNSAYALKRSVNEREDPTVFVMSGLEPEYSFYRPGQKAMYVGTGNSYMDFPADFVLGHEAAHAYTRQALGTNIGGAQKEALDQNQNAKKDGHDEKAEEKHADIWGVKNLLYKEGIYDSRSNEDITPEAIQQLREKYPNLRFLQQNQDNEKAAWMLNHIAQNNNKSKLVNHAKYGGILRRK